jgi:hypothetical protein
MFKGNFGIHCTVFTVVLISVLVLFQKNKNSKLDETEVSHTIPIEPSKEVLAPRFLLEMQPKITTRLLNQANSNILAAREINDSARLAYSCRNIPESQTELEEWILNANQNNEIPEIIESVSSRFDKCVNIDRSIHYVERFFEAAKKGSDDAVDMLWFLTNKELIEGFDLAHLSRDEIVAKLSEIKAEMYDLSRNIALLGGEKSMFRLIRGFQHFDPATKGQNFEKSLAYTYLLLATTDDNDNYQKADKSRQWLEKRMTFDETNNAIRIFNELKSKYKKI